MPTLPCPIAMHDSNRDEHVNSLSSVLEWLSIKQVSYFLDSTPWRLFTYRVCGVSVNTRAAIYSRPVFIKQSLYLLRIHSGYGLMLFHWWAKAVTTPTQHLAFVWGPAFIQSNLPVTYKCGRVYSQEVEIWYVPATQKTIVLHLLQLAYLNEQVDAKTSVFWEWIGVWLWEKLITLLCGSDIVWETVGYYFCYWKQESYTYAEWVHRGNQRGCGKDCAWRWV